MNTQIQPQSELENSISLNKLIFLYRQNYLNENGKILLIDKLLNSSLDIKPSNSVSLPQVKPTPDNGTKPEDTIHSEIKELYSEKDSEHIPIKNIVKDTWDKSNSSQNLSADTQKGRSE